MGLIEAGFLFLGSVDTGGPSGHPLWGAVLGTVGCGAASLDHTHSMPGAPSPGNHRCPRHGPVSPEGAESPADGNHWAELCLIRFYDSMIALK